jgi:hypothetical protein
MRDTEGGGVGEREGRPPPGQGSILTAINQSTNQSSDRIPQVHRDRFVGVSMRPLKKKGNRGTQREGGGGERERSSPAPKDVLSEKTALGQLLAFLSARGLSLVDVLHMCVPSDGVLDSPIPRAPQNRPSTKEDVSPPMFAACQRALVWREGERRSPPGQWIHLTASMQSVRQR